MCVSMLLRVCAAVCVSFFGTGLWTRCQEWRVPGWWLADRLYWAWCPLLIKLGTRTIPTSKTVWSWRHNLYQTIIERKCQITNPLSNQTSWDTNRTTISIPKQWWETTYSRGNASPKAYRFRHNQALRFICFTGHVRARGSKLWRHRWYEASEFLCTETPLFGGSWATKIIAKKTQKCSRY